MTTHALDPGCPVDESFDPLSPEFLADPFAVLGKLPPGHERPVFFAPSIGYYVVTRHAEIEQVFRDHDTYSATIAQAPLVPLVPEAQQILLAGGYKPAPTMVSLDEPAHARLRRPTARAFSIKRVHGLIPAIEATTAALLDAVAGQTEFDLVAALAFPLPANIVFSLIGVPERDYAQLKQWCGYRAALSWGRPDPADQVDIARSIAAYRGYIRILVDAKDSERADDLTSDLLAIHDEDPERLTLDEISSILFSLSFAGHETTTGLIGNTIRRLLEDQSRWQAVVEQPELLAAAIEETLRFDTPVPVWRRVTTRPDTLGGVRLPAAPPPALPLAGRSGPGSGCVRRARPVRPEPAECRSARRVRQGPALLPRRKPRQARSAARHRRAGPPVPGARASAGTAPHLPPEHLLPGAAVAARPVRPGSLRPTRQVVRPARLRWRILTF